jgi:hypothetical protein
MIVAAYFRTTGIRLQENRACFYIIEQQFELRKPLWAADKVNAKGKFVSVLFLTDHHAMKAY